MPVNGLNVGKDVTLNIVTPAGLLRIKGRKSFSSRQMTHALTHVGMDGNIRLAELPAGWEGDIEIDRADSSLDDYMARSEADYYSGVTTATISISETITNPDGSTSQYLYAGVVLKYSDAGKKSGDAFIAQKLDWRAARRHAVI